MATTNSAVRSHATRIDLADRLIGTPRKFVPSCDKTIKLCVGINGM
jgi:hypothetical protein